jgi:hypothetical protein
MRQYFTPDVFGSTVTDILEFVTQFIRQKKFSPQRHTPGGHKLRAQSIKDKTQKLNKIIFTFFLRVLCVLRGESFKENILKFQPQ